MQPHPRPRGGLRDQLNPDNNNLALNPGGLTIGDTPDRLHHAQPDLVSPSIGESIVAEASMTCLLLTIPPSVPDPGLSGTSIRADLPRRSRNAAGA